MENEVWFLKNKAAMLYCEYQKQVAPYDCGAALAQYINPDIAKTAAEFDEVMDKLAALDPMCPAFRLKAR